MFLLSFIATISHTKKGVLSVVCSVLGHPPQIRPLSLVEDTVECKSYLVLIATIYDFILKKEGRANFEVTEVKGGHWLKQNLGLKLVFYVKSAFLFQNHLKSKHLLWLHMILIWGIILLSVSSLELNELSEANTYNTALESRSNRGNFANSK